MMEFTICEVYANEANVGFDAHDGGHGSSHATKSSNQSGERVATNSNTTTSSRAFHVLQPDYLPVHDGTVLHWQPQQACGFIPPIVNQLRNHNGAVLSMVFTHELGKEGLLFTGSVDRSIKIWDPWGGSEAQLHSRSNHYCVQTISAHAGSVVAVKLMRQQNHALVSCSLDHTIKTWYPSDGRGLLLYPWYVPGQTISYASEAWPMTLVVREGASAALFVGDSSGCISLYTSSSFASSEDGDGDSVDVDAHRRDSGILLSETNSPEVGVAAKYAPFKLKRKHSHFHSLGVLQLQLIADNSLVVSLGFDQKAQVLDAISGALSSTLTNSNQARFTCCAWDARGQFLVLGDALGFVQIYDVFQDKVLRKLRLLPAGSPLLSIDVATIQTGDFLFAGSASCTKQWRISRDVGYTECSGHTEAITALAIIRDDDGNDLGDHQNDGGTSHRFFSASLDNTIRCWDSYDMKASFGFEERTAEVTCMVPSKLHTKIFTDHENGTVKAWGIHTGQFVKTQVETHSAVTCLASGIIRDQEFLLAGDIDGVISIWEVAMDGFTHAATIQAMISKENRRDEVTSLSFSSGKYIPPRQGSGQAFFVAGCNTGQIALWHFSKKTMLSCFQAHSESIGALAMHGWFLFSGSDDTWLRMWNLLNVTGPYELGTLRPPFATSSSGSGSAIVGIDVVPMLGYVVSAFADGTILVWDYGAFESDNDGDGGSCDFDAYGKIVYRSKYVMLRLC
ncbi:F-box protein, partial [Globisporangium splendens]